MTWSVCDGVILHEQDIFVNFAAYIFYSTRFVCYVPNIAKRNILHQCKKYEY